MTSVSADLEAALTRYPGAEVYRPGDSPDLVATVLRLIRSGAKTATCAPMSEFEEGGEAFPVVGRVDIALDWEGRPACATRTLSVETFRFCDMDEARVPTQGEFRNLAEWRQGYEAYLRRAGLFAPDLRMMYERFELVEDFGAP